MSFGRNKRAARLLPADTDRRVTAYGKAMRARTGGDDYTLEPEMHELWQRDRDGFLAAMAALAERGGLTAFGVERLVVSVTGGDLDHPAYDQIMRHGLEYLRQQGVGPESLSGYEASYWSRVSGGRPWGA